MNYISTPTTIVSEQRNAYQESNAPNYALDHRSPSYRHGLQQSKCKSPTEGPTSAETVSQFIQPLFYLHHACTCQATEGQCEYDSRCANAKDLVKHVKECKDKDCQISHCSSSRVIMNHYLRCKNKMKCLLCASVMKNMTPKRSGLGMSPSKFVPAITEQELVKNYIDDSKRGPSSSTDSLVKRRRTESQSLNTADDMELSSIEPLPLYAANQSVPSTISTTSTASTTNLNAAVLSRREAEKSHMNYLACKAQLDPKELKRKCVDMVQLLQAQEECWLFNDPVDPVELKIPDYFDVIKTPMDLGTVLSKIESGEYHSLEECSADVCLTFDNALMYNAKDSLVYEKALEYKGNFLSAYIAMRNNVKMETDRKSRSSPSDSDKLEQLLLLYHSSKCRNLHGLCSFGYHCGETKILWKHMAKCSDNKCQMKNCFSSRTLLDHFVKCKDQGCSLCSAVRKSRRKKSM